jgi:hypothetical protein
MRRSVTRAATLAIAAAGVLAVDGCTERLEGGRACPILCPDQNVELRDTLVAAVALDTTLGSFPPIGEEPQLLLTSRGDTLETRIIIRYDTLPTTYRPPGSPTTDAPIEMVDSARLAIRLHFPARDENQTVTIEAYDVDTTVADGGASDTVAATMLPLFRPDRFLGSLTFRPADLRTDPVTDSTARIPIDSAYLLAKIQAKARLRVGLLVRAAGSTELVFQGVALRSQELTFKVSPDAAVALGRTGPYSATPTERFIANALSDFVIVAKKRPADTPAEVLAIGGIPGRRAYLRFDLPRGIVDSTSVVRATLLLTQYPNRLAAHGPDTISLYPQPVSASEQVTDLTKAAALLTPIFADPWRSIFRLDSLRTAPEDSGAVAIEVVGAIQVWRGTPPEQVTRALVLRVPGTSEGVVPDELYFYSTEAPAAFRPRLRIVYGPRVGIGLP